MSSSRQSNYANIAVASHMSEHESAALQGNVEERKVEAEVDERQGENWTVPTASEDDNAIT
jgi:hypothetical protein